MQNIKNMMNSFLVKIEGFKNKGIDGLVFFICHSIKLQWLYIIYGKHSCIHLNYIQYLITKSYQLVVLSDMHVQVQKISKFIYQFFIFDWI